MDDLFDVFNDTDAQQAKAVKTKRKAPTQDNGVKKQKLSEDKSSLDPSISIAADAAREKLIAKEAIAAAAAKVSQAASSGILGSPALPDHLDMDPSEPALSEDDASFYRYTEQHVSAQAKIERDDGRSAVTEVCYPPGWDLSVDPHAGWVRPEKAAKEYPFVLDPFQQYAVDCLEKNQSVLVSAHTSAGKTVVAEYAIAMALRDGQRVIYTSPIKALSNQKYRELYEEFNDVGLMTGDVTINPSASCLVMTTEILRNMLYRGSEVVRECAFVIMDEVHYMRNRERGVVWEETIIMLPDKVRYVFLSATIPNGTEFALWVAKLHKQPCSVVYTDYRPTPLQHYLFPAGGDGLYLVVDEKGNFKEENFQKALAVLKADPATEGISGGKSSNAPDEKEGGGGGGGKGSKKKKGGKPTATSDIYKIVRMIMERHYEPVIVFSFSKRECEQHALNMAKLDFCDDDEKKLIEQIFRNAMDALSEDDKHLPQVENILPLLKRGIGIHHGGLLPILKEVIEILFQESLLKCLFSTETFSMGLNFPCKTTVFTSVKKWDGENFRIVSSGEYIQMSGRAGRRGLDDKGIVICMMDEQLEPNQAKEMIKGQTDPLDSSFHLGYNMLLNLLRVEDQNPVKMMARSFLQFQSTRKAPKLQEQMEEVEQKRAEIVLRDAKLVSEYYHLQQQLSSYQSRMLSYLIQPSYILPFLNPGRLLHVKAEQEGGVEWGWGVLVNFQKKTLAKDSKIKAPDGGNVVYVLDVLLECAPGSGQQLSAAAAKKNRSKLPQNQKPLFTPAAAASPSERAHSEYLVVPIMLHLVDAISSVRLFVPKDMKAKDAKSNTGKTLEEVKRTFTTTPEAAAEVVAKAETKDKKKSKKDKAKEQTPTPTPAASSSSAPATLSIPLLDPVTDMKITDETFLGLLKKADSLKERIQQHKLHTAADREEQLSLYRQRVSYDEQLLQLKSDLKTATQDVQMHTQLKHMQVVLRRLEHTTADNVIDLKGRIACEISTSDELLATELMFLGVFNELAPEQLVALCSALVFNEKSSASDDQPIRLKEELAAPLRQLQEAARRIGQVMADARLAIDVEEYVAKFQPQLMDVVYAWCKGAKFSEVCKMTDVFEGTIIRCLRRLEELLRQFANAAKSVGNELLESKFNAGINMLKRDIVFAASLYL